MIDSPQEQFEARADTLAAGLDEPRSDTGTVVEMVA